MSGNNGNGAESRWKKGQSGNPNGRPAGPPRKSIMSEVLKQVVGETFMTTEGENARDVTRLEMLINALVRHAEHGDKTCLTLLLKELRHIDDRDAVVNSPAEQALQKMKEASESLIRKMNEFRAEEEPGWEPPEGMKPATAPEPKADSDTGETSAKDGFVAEPRAQETDAAQPPGETEYPGGRQTDPSPHIRENSREPRQSPQEAAQSLERIMREFREEEEAEEHAAPRANGTPGPTRKRE